MGNSNRRKYIILVILLIALLGASFAVYTITSAVSGDNNVRVNSIIMTSIKTGTSSWTASDGLSYPNQNSIGYSQIEGYTAGDDSNGNNRIVRSFDSITYNFSFDLVPKDGVNHSYDRTVKITVTLSNEESKYIACNKNDKPGEKTCVYEIEGVDTGSSEEGSVTLYVLGAPNGTLISPKFNIKESTDTEEGVNLGQIDPDYSGVKDNTKYYSYENSYYDTVAQFNNYLPTVVSSKEGSISMKILKLDGEYQSAIYNDGNESKVGRYITYVAGIYLNPSTSTGIKGLTLPTDNISFDATFTQNGNTTPIVKEEWIRSYSPSSLGVINPVVVNMPYSTTEANNKAKQVLNPGKISVTPKSANTYTVNITDCVPTFYYPTIGADNKALSESYITTIALTAFSPRVKADKQNDINVNLNTSNGTIGSSSINASSAEAINKYYENSDYSVDAAFYDVNDTKLSETNNVNGIIMKNGGGALSKGTTFKFKTKFNYSKTLSDSGLKEVVKIDDNAFRFIPLEEGSSYKDYTLTLNCGGSKCNNISSDDFEVKFVSGSFDASNYTATDVSSINFGDSDDKAKAVSQCATVASELSEYNVNQVQNLYGGPCITAIDGKEQAFDTIVSGKEDEKEIHLTKAIIQTKEGVVLPDEISISVEFNVRVRNVSDLTQTYQGTVVVSTSDYDKELYYYTPKITDDIDSVCNKDNYIKTVYKGRNIVVGDDSTFGDSLRIVNFTSREEMTVLNKNADGTVKTNYDISNNETITYNIKTIIEDNNEVVGADDVWYINSLVVGVAIPSTLEYLPDNDLIQPEAVKYCKTINDSSEENCSNEYDSVYKHTMLLYRLPYTKPNMKIPEIDFRAKIRPTLSGSSSAVPITVTSSVSAQNINGETDNSVIGLLSANFTIYATGLNSVIVQQKVGKSGTIVEKNSEINYILSAYNNTGKAVENYGIIDVLPYTKDENGSKISGTYSVKVTMPDSLSGATILCSKQTPTNIVKEINNKDNVWEECDITEEYLDKITAIKVQDISMPVASYMDDIIISLKPKNNKYSDTYNNTFMGETSEHTRNNSNVIKVGVVSRKISGKVFIDVTGNGVKDGKEKYLSGIGATLYKIEDDNSVTKVKETVTDKNGYYEFKDLDKGRFKIRFLYDNNKYDLTLRYATEDTNKDSDAYKISDNGEAEISNKKIPDDPNGIRLSKELTKAENMDMGLIPKQSLGFEMKKYITKVDLSYNGTLSSKNYNNQSTVSITVRNTKSLYAKVYYGISIKNNSYKSGYVKLLEEDIPTGMIFDPTAVENQDWFESGGVVYSKSLEDVLIEPGETKYLQIVLYMPERGDGGQFLNTVSVMDCQLYEPEALADDKTETNHDDYNIGDSIKYAGINWHVIGVTGVTREQAIANLGIVEEEEGAGFTEEQENEISGYIKRNQILTLFADSGTISETKAHTSAANTTYRWSESEINKYINGNWTEENSLNLSILYDQVICDDASGLQNASYGGNLINQDGGRCISGIYTTSKVRLLTLAEFTALKSKGSWMFSSGSYAGYWLENSDYVSPTYLQKYENAYHNNVAKTLNNSDGSSKTGVYEKNGQVLYEDVDYHNQQNSVYDQAMYISRADTDYKKAKANTAYEVRPVITVSTYNIIPE